MNKKTTTILSVLLMGLLSFGLMGCEKDPKSVKFELQDPINLDFHTEHQAAYLIDSNYNNIGPYSAFAEREGYSSPAGIHLHWNVTAARSYDINVSENADMSDAITYQKSGKAGKNHTAYNTKLNTKYYWTVTAHYKSNSFTSDVASFTTADTILRNIFVSGVDNVRDLGGYKLANGKAIKQGVLYRSGQMNKDKVTDMQVLATDDGMDVLKNQLKIKTDIDLRKNVEIDGTIENSSLNKSPIDNATYCSLPMYYDGQNMLEHTDPDKLARNKESIVEFFDILADSSNYPVIYHCVQGKDRTGLLSYLVGALLGMNEADLYRDYLFTNFSQSVGSPCKSTDISNRYGATIGNVEGDTLSAKTYKYLNETLSIPTSTLDNVIGNLSE